MPSTRHMRIPYAVAMTQWRCEPLGYGIFYSLYSSADSEFAKLKLGDLSIVTTLGVGGFGRVELVRNHPYLYYHTSNPSALVLFEKKTTTYERMYPVPVTSSLENKFKFT